MSKTRLIFSKSGKAKYISHLDLMATMRRSLLRAGINLEYSEGFNPHPYMSVALPLPVGCSSICELIDIGIAGETTLRNCLDLINDKLPEGLEITEAYVPLRKFSGIAWIMIEGCLHYDNGAPINAVEELAECFSKKSIIISKKTKRGISELDITPLVKEVCFNNNYRQADKEIITVSAKISAQNPSINPENLMCAIKDGNEALIPDFYDFTRMEVLDKDMIIFR